MIETIALENIRPNPYQTRLREDPDHIQKLIDSIQVNGLLQTPIGRWSAEDPEAVELAFGHSRLAAYKQLNEEFFVGAEFAAMPVVIQELTDEELFVLAVSENCDRKDLTPIETARAMLTYRDQFSKTSKEIGELFHLSDSAVRNKIRLLDLPDHIQEKIGDGEIAESAARSLLQLQRIDPQEVEKVVQTAAEEQLTSEEIIHEAGHCLRWSTNAHTLHESWQGDPPKAGSHLWALRDWVPPKVNRPAYLEEAAEMFKKELKPENTGLAQEFIDEFNSEMFISMDLAYRADPLQWEQEYRCFGARALEVFRVLADQDHNCAQCPLYLVKNRTHYCGFKPCWTWRKQQFKESVFQAVSSKMGIPAYNRSQDGVYDHLGNYQDWRTSGEVEKAIRDLFGAWLESKDACLRLHAIKSSEDVHAFTDSPLVALVCVSEEALNAVQQLVKAGEKKRDTGPGDWQINAAKRDASDEFIEKVAAPIFSRLFDGMPHDFLQWIYKNRTEDNQPEDCAVALAYKWLEDPVSWDEKKEGPIALANTLGELAKRCGLEISKSWYEAAEQMEPKFD